MFNDKHINSAILLFLQNVILSQNIFKIQKANTETVKRNSQKCVNFCLGVALTSVESLSQRHPHPFDIIPDGDWNFLVPPFKVERKKHGPFLLLSYMYIGLDVDVRPLFSSEFKNTCSIWS